MTEFSHKRTLLSSRSTDTNTSETSVVDDVTQPPPNSSPGEQQQQHRVYKKANKRVNKKAKGELRERILSQKSQSMIYDTTYAIRVVKNKIISVFLMKQTNHKSHFSFLLEVVVLRGLTPL